MVRAKACNLVGNLCSNSSLFYQYLDSNRLIPPLIQCCHDSDPSVRTFAVVATGNAGFHGSELYESLRPAVRILQERLQDKVSPIMRANAAGALGNFVRNGGHLIPTFVQKGIIESLLKVALTDDSVEARRIALFSLGNILKYEEGRKTALRPGLRFLTLLESLARASSDQRIKKNHTRIQRILREAPMSANLKPR
ncbi:hypothetical protein AAMO2058_001486700 [Amorphochlora amoebiformis]